MLCIGKVEETQSSNIKIEHTPFEIGIQDDHFVCPHKLTYMIYNKQHISLIF